MYGPTDLDRMLAWAAAGRIAPEDSISRDGEHWAPAPAFAELELCWMMEDEDGQRYGPVHIAVFQSLRDEGRLAPQTRLFNTRTGNMLPLAEALPASPEPPPEEEQAPPGSDLPAAWSVIARERDLFVSEAERWKTRYEEEHRSARADAEAREQRIRELETETIRLHAQAEQSAIECRRLRTLLKSADEQTGGELLAAHHELTQRFDDLCARYDEKIAESQTRTEQVELTRREAEECEQQLRRRLEQERTASDDLRKKLATLETAYGELLRSLREINDGFIQYRSGRPREPAPKAPPPQAKPAKAEPERPAEKPSGPRIRLTR